MMAGFGKGKNEKMSAFHSGNEKTGPGGRKPGLSTAVGPLTCRPDFTY
jgi:hypothetical protein